MTPAIARDPSLVTRESDGALLDRLGSQLELSNHQPLVWCRYGTVRHAITLLESKDLAVLVRGPRHTVPKAVVERPLWLEDPQVVDMDAEIVVRIRSRATESFLMPGRGGKDASIELIIRLMQACELHPWLTGALAILQPGRCSCVSRTASLPLV